MVSIYCNKCKKPIGDTCCCKALNKQKKEIIFWINDWSAEGQPFGVKGLLKKLIIYMTKKENQR